MGRKTLKEGHCRYNTRPSPKIDRPEIKPASQRPKDEREIIFDLQEDLLNLMDRNLEIRLRIK